LPPCSGGSNMSDDRPAPQLLAPAFVERLARKRVALGFVTAAAALIVSNPTWRTWRFGLAVALAGEAIRVWAAGHLEKSREITRSGPYRWTRHPLYAGSGLIALGIVIASNSIAVTVLASVYMVATIGAAVRTEEAFLGQAFGDAYDRYQRSAGEPMRRRFSLERAVRNREYRAMMGLLAGFGILALKVVLPI
jgi:isoprenylcysteine carboxyl methyltransferase (ICMT) family protein YpbQ